MNKKMVNRIIIYVAGLLVLALGIILNTKAGLWSLTDYLGIVQHIADQWL